MTFEKKVQVETPYGVKNFQNLHFQKTFPNMEKRLAKKNFQFKDIPRFYFVASRATYVHVCCYGDSQ